MFSFQNQFLVLFLNQIKTNEKKQSSYSISYVINQFF